MSFGFFLSHTSSRRFLEKAEREQRGYERERSRRRFVAVLVLSTFCFFFLSFCSFAQERNGSGSSERESFDSFLTGASAEKNSRSRTNGTRPPEPKQTLEGLVYPEGFLTLSTPSPDPDEILLERESSKNSGTSIGSTAENKSDLKSPKFLNPGLETTPYLRPVERAQEEHGKKGRLYFFAFSIALAALGLFVYFDYRYREQLRLDLERNARLSSPQAVSADFADFPPGSLDAPVLIPQRNSYESEDYRYASSVGVASIPISRAVEEDGEALEANFDFTPQGTSDADASLEPQEDFVVSKTDE